MADNKYYIGLDLKFRVAIEAPGFNQVSDNYTLDFYCGKEKMSFTQDDVIEDTDGNFFLFIPTSELSPGIMKMVITAFVPDDDSPTGIRKEVGVVNLGPLRITV